MYVPTTSSGGGSRMTVFGGENVRQKALLCKKSSKEPAGMKIIIHFYLYNIQEGESEDDILIITCTLLGLTSYS